MRLKFLSICSGIEAASVAFAPLGWEALAFAEIEPFPCAVLAHHYPQVPNLGDLTQWRTWPAALLVQVELLCGGTPCQAFSVAGLRASLADDRGNLSLIFCELYAHINQLRHAAGLPPALLLWENVPGVLSTHDNAFGCFLAGIAGEVDALQPPGGKWAHAGYVSGPSASIAYRTLDAQYFGLAQRRKRVFVVASADPAFDPAAVLFEFTGLRRDTPPRRETGQTTAPTLSARAKGGGGLGTDADCDGACIPEIAQSQALAGTLRITDGGSDVEHARANHIVATAAKAIPEICAPLTTNYHADNESQESKLIPHLANCLTRRMHKGPNTTLDEGPTLLVDVTHSLRAEGFDASEDGTGRGTPLVPVPSNVVPPLGGPDESPLPFVTTQITSAANRSQPKAGDPCHPLAAGAHAPAIAFSAKDHGADAHADLAPTLRAGNHNTSHPNSGNWLAGAFPERLSGTQCASAEDLAPVLQSHNPTAVCTPEPFAFDLRGREGGAMPEGPHATAAMRASSGGSGGSSRSYIAAPEALAYTLHGTREGTREVVTPADTAGTIREGTGSAIQNSSNTLVSQPVAFQERGREGGRNVETQEEIAYSLNASAQGGRRNEMNVLDTAWRVRRLTPEECELLQGFPIGYTLLPAKGGRLRKGPDLAQTIAYLLDLGMDELTAIQCAHSPDGPRYKALGNSWAINVVRWIGKRISQHLPNNHPISV